SLLGSLALIGFPGFSGFFSKDALIEAVHASEIAGSGIAYWAVLSGVFITALYSFRMFFLVFHGEPRMDTHTREHLRESPAVVTIPLVLLAIPSVVIGWPTIGPVLFGDFFGSAITVAPQHDVLREVGSHFDGPAGFLLHGLMSPAFFLAMAGLFAAWFIYLRRPTIAEQVQARAAWLNKVLLRKYYFDDFNEKVLAAGSRFTGRLFWRAGDGALIDALLVNGSARTVGWLSGVVRRVQSGYLYHYAFAMIIGLALIVGWFIYRINQGGGAA
ncbi:MAG: NADH-quinone oxidoreductase subunit L, partial [Gammaproteobacteria bacterium]|nr:NADH-quinone oxidoreductase subunit L [Gammaproteobacteria bacterium]